MNKVIIIMAILILIIIDTRMIVLMDVIETQLAIMGECK